MHRVTDSGRPRSTGGGRAHGSGSLHIGPQAALGREGEGQGAGCLLKGSPRLVIPLTTSPIRSSSVDGCHGGFS
ncbi:hypothetical protein WMY93_029097 [Mugilogobius chulae]|uniref:Uncharacterized protein n=1 Tax=Mugilogobius chulae TaxID=88201 RepID=A0AAW0MQC6_9GOBI